MNPEAGDNLVTLTAQLVAGFRPACEARGLGLVIDCPVPSERAFADRATWGQIVDGLLRNFMERSARGTIKVSLRVRNGIAKLGITCSEITNESNGAAGLARLHDLVQSHSGSMDELCTPGEDYTVTVLLPLTTSETDADHSSRSARVVVVDDSEEMRDFLSIALRRAGYEVQALPDGAAALAACRRRVPDVVVADVLMQGMDGIELIACLRSDQDTAAIPVLLLSGRDLEESRVAGFTAGADDYLVKPVSRRELVARVEGAVRMARLRREAARRQQADFESLFSTAFDGILVLDCRGRILMANERAGQLFGHPPRDLESQSIEAFVQGGSEERDTPRAATDTQGESSLPRGYRELSCRHRDGTEFFAEVGRGPIRFKHLDCTVVNVRDISERRQAQEKLNTAMARLEALSERFTRAQEEERQKIAFELHEQLGQDLTTLKLHLQMIEIARQDPSEVHRQSALSVVGGLLQRVRSMALDLRPPQLDDFGLYSALRAHCLRQADAAGWIMHFEAPESAERPDREVELACFRVVQEALTNTMRYARATEVWLSLRERGGELHLTLRDNGVGFDTTEFRQGRPSESLGLIGMAERMRQVGGRLEIDSSADGGTQIRAAFPLMHMDVTSPA